MSQIEEKLLAALAAEADEMKPADWDQMRERVRQTSSVNSPRTWIRADCLGRHTGF